MILQGDCLEVLATLPENSVDTCITDPPYGLGFMGKQWDTFDKSQFGIAGNEGENDLKVKKSFNVLPRYRKDGLQEFTYKWASEVYRVLKPGAIMLAFGGTRTYHRMVCAIEDAGFEIRDTIAWVYGSGFPKSYDISKGIDKQAGAEREVIGLRKFADGTTTRKTAGNFDGSFHGQTMDTIPSTPEAQLWDGWGTALKPAFEPIVVAMKPIDGTFVNNALTWGVAGLNIDGGRVELNGSKKTGGGCRTREDNKSHLSFMAGQINKEDNSIGRFPANLIHDGSDEVVALFPDTKVGARRAGQLRHTKDGDINFTGDTFTLHEYPANEGSASRFFYCAKASRAERNAGLEGMELRDASKMSGGEETRQDRLETGLTNHPQMQNHHPTVKPIELMRYLVRLTKTPTGGVVLDPFTGSGTTGIACVLEGREFIGIEREPEYVEIAEKRIAHYRLPIMDEVGA